MKPLVVAAASLLLLSAVWTGAEPLPAPAVYELAGAPKTRTPKPTKKAITKTPREKPTKAAKTPKPKKANFSGDVLAVDEANLTIRTKDGKEVSFLINSGTSLKIPSLGKDATLADIHVGAHAAVQALEGEDGSLTALRISVSPRKPAPKHHVGEVTAYEEGVRITILAHDGNEFTFRITEETKILPAGRAGELAVGRRVTIISPRDVTGGPFVAKGIVVHPDTDDDEEAAETPEATPTATPTPTPTDTPTAERTIPDTPAPG
jgi:hypothetical protein